MKKILLIGLCAISGVVHGQLTFQVPTDYIFATQCTNGPINEASNSIGTVQYSGTSTSNWFDVSNTAIELAGSQTCIFGTHSEFQPFSSFSVAIRAKLSVSAIDSVLQERSYFVIWSNGPQALFLTSNLGTLQVNAFVKNNSSSGYSTASVVDDGTFSNALNGWVTYYLVYDIVSATETRLRVGFNGNGLDDMSEYTNLAGEYTPVYTGGASQDFTLGRSDVDFDHGFTGKIDYCYMYDYALTQTQLENFGENVDENLVAGSTTIVPREPYHINYTYDWCLVTNDGSGDVFTSTGATTYSYTPTTTGTYMCKIGYGGAFTTYTEYATITVNTNPSGVEVYNKENSSIYPNPTNQNFFIKNAEGSFVSIFDIAGKNVLTINNYMGEGIDISNLANGIYNVRTQKENIIQTSKLIKE